MTRLRCRYILLLAVAVCFRMTCGQVPVIQDQFAYVGRLFELRTEHELQIRESYKTGLPDWLEYDEKSGVLSGIAPQGTSGMMFSIDVTPATSGDDVVPDIFTISVGGEVPKKKDDDSIIRCRPTSSVTVATIQLGGHTSLEKMTPWQKVSILKTIAKQLDSKPLPFLLLNPSTKHDTVLVSGPGDYKKDDVLLELVWVVGCGNVAGKQVKLLQSLEKQSLNGELTRALSKYLGNGGVIGWKVSNIKSKSTRVKRQVHVRPTPTLAISTIPVPKLRTTVKPKKKKVPTATLR